MPFPLNSAMNGNHSLVPSIVRGGPGVGAHRNRAGSRVISSTGRSQVAAPQGFVVEKVRMLRTGEVHEERRRVFSAIRAMGEEALAPVGSEEDLIILKGDVLFTIRDDSTSGTVRTALAGDAALQVYSAVNGLPSTTDLVFAGVAVYSPHKQRDNDVGTMAYAGMCTIINNGPQSIADGMTVFMGNYPFKTCSTHGNEVPAVSEPGQSSMKFRPTIYGLVDTDKYAYRRSIEMEVNDQVDKAKSFSAVKEYIDDEIFFQCPKEHPLRLYARLYAIHRIVFSSKGPTAEAKAAVEDFVSMYRDSTREHGILAARKRYDSAISAASQPKSGFELTIQTHSSADFLKDNDLLLTLLEQVRQAMNIAAEDYHSYFRNKVIGKCVRFVYVVTKSIVLRSMY